MTAQSRFLRRLGWLSLGCFALVTLLGKSYERSLPPNDSALHAKIALQATTTIVPKLPIEGVTGFNTEGKFNDHPFTMFVLDGWIMRALGANAWSARLLPGILSAGCVLLTGALGTLLLNETFGFMAAILMAITPEFIKFSASFHLDAPMIFFILLSFVLWRRGRWGLAGIAAGFGVWIKTPVALLVVPVAGLELWATAKLRENFKKWLLLVTASLITVFCLWGAILAFGGWEVLRDYFVRQVWGTAVGGRGFNHPEPFMFFTYAVKRFIPGILLVIASLVLLLRTRESRARWRDPSFLVPALALVIVVGILSPMRFKYDYYFLPTFPFLALIAARIFIPWLERWEWRPYAVFSAITPPLLMAALTCPISFGPEAFPTLKRFNAFIQSYGSCEDRVLFVPGGQPYAAEGDYGIEVHFYTGRKLLPASCTAAPELAARAEVGWIIISDENFEKCLPEPTRAKFPVRIRFGNQLLLTNRIPVDPKTGQALDLTPLERELQASIDCKPVELPRDRYHRYEGE